MPGLSVVLITLNEAGNIRRCLESVKDLADEILVVDSGSTDGTRELAASLGAHVIHQDFLGYIEQKNFATSRAVNQWVLSLDADEALSPELKESIRSAMVNPAASGYAMNRLTNYCGAWVRHGGWYPDRKVRLYRKDAGRWEGVNPHDRYTLFDGARPQWLKGDLLHYSYHSITDHLRQIDHFSSVGARALYAKGVSSSLLKIFYKPVARFIRNYVIKGGFRDGMTGLVIGINSMHAVFLKYLRLYFLYKGREL